MSERPEGWPPAGEPDVQPLPPGPPPIFCDWIHYRDATCPCAYCSRRAATSPPADLRELREFRPGLYGRVGASEPSMLGILQHPTWWPNDRPASGVQSLLDDVG